MGNIGDICGERVYIEGVLGGKKEGREERKIV